MTAEPPVDGFWPAGRTAAAAITFDVDAESAILSSVPGSERRLSLMTHQGYGPRTGVPRLIRLLEERNLPATFFVPGYTAERWPDAIRRIRDAGYEIAHHGYLHEPLGADEATEERFLVRGLEALDHVAGVRPIGYRAPNWETSYATPGLLARHGFRYDSSLMDADRPYQLAIGPEPDARRLVEIPIHWGLDDWEQYAYIPDEERSGVIESPGKVREMWGAELRATAAEHGCSVFTMHPFLSGRPSRAAALADLLDEMVGMQDKGLWIADLQSIAAHVERLELPAVHNRPQEVPPGWLPR
jgi:peptidoglycan/xylan/chitin deacetylase (PgdA/CDA1 family)